MPRDARTAAARREDAAKHPDDGGFAGTVRPEEPKDRALAHRKAHAIHRCEVAEAFRQVLDFDHGIQNLELRKSGRGFQLWQPESHPIVLDSAKIIEQKLNYIHQNPVDAGFVHEAADWKYSIARDYRGEKGIIEINYLGNEYV